MEGISGGGGLSGDPWPVAEEGRQSEAAPRRRRFECPGPPPKRAQAIPTASSIRSGGAWISPPRHVADNINRGHWLIGVDIETHDWDDARGRQGSIGRFGHYSLCSEQDLQARVVQLGWAIGPIADWSSAVMKERIITPMNFVISDKASRFHGITHDHAIECGSCLGKVLEEFMSDALQAVQEHDARLVCHHLEFDAAIIANEFLRCGLPHLEARWAGLARGGICTMDPEIGRWLRSCRGNDTGSTTAKHCLSLKETIAQLSPESSNLLLPAKHQSAGADAVLHGLIAVTLRAYAYAPSTVGPESH